VDVASYRLAIHLGLAFVILGYLAWYIFGLQRSGQDLLQARRNRDSRLVLISTIWAGFTLVQVLLGALVAGIDAGRSYTDWPLMGSNIVPQDAFVLTPLWSNFFENPGLVQFIHRCVGYALLAFAIYAWRNGRASAHRRTQASFNLAFVALCFQVLLGIATVMTSAPWHIAILHQLLAVAVWVMILRARFLSHYPITTSIRGS